jgi:hypothetical protein
MESVIAGVHLVLTPEPLYATVNKRNRRSPPDGCSSVSPPAHLILPHPQVPPPPPPPPEFDDNFMETDLDDSITHQIEQLECQYGGKLISNVAATTIQRAYRSTKLQRQFDRLLKLAKSAERLDRRLSLLEPSTLDYKNGCYYDGSEINVDTGMPMKESIVQNQLQGHGQSSSSSTLVPMDEIDRLILQAAGLSTFSSPPTSSHGPSARHIKNRKSSSKPNLTNTQQHQQYLRRTTSLRLDREKNNKERHAKKTICPICNLDKLELRLKMIWKFPIHHVLPPFLLLVHL